MWVNMILTIQLYVLGWMHALSSKETAFKGSNWLLSKRGVRLKSRQRWKQLGWNIFHEKNRYWRESDKRKFFWGKSPGNQSHAVMPFRTSLFSVAFCVSDNFNVSYQYLWCWKTVDAFTLAAIVLWCWCCQDAPQQIGANVRAISISLLICTSRKEYHSQAGSTGQCESGWQDNVDSTTLCWDV